MLSRSVRMSTDRAKYRDQKGTDRLHLRYSHIHDPYAGLTFERAVIKVINVMPIPVTATRERASCTAATTADLGVMPPSLQSGICESISLSPTFTTLCWRLLQTGLWFDWHLFCHFCAFLFSLGRNWNLTNTFFLSWLSPTMSWAGTSLPCLTCQPRWY